MGEPSISDAAATVEPRDFSQPRRLGSAQQLGIRRAIEAELPRIESELQQWLREVPTVSLAGLGEVSARGLFDGLEDPVAIQVLEVAGAQGWAIWTNDAALRCATRALGAELPDEVEARPLSPLEAGVVSDLLLELAQHAARPFGLSPRPLGLPQSQRELATFGGPDHGEDSQRLFLHFDIDGPIGASTLRLYLPGVLPERRSTTRIQAPSLPSHLDDVPVTICAELGGAEVPLSDLVSMEVGDVIPLDRRVGQPIDVLIEGEPAGRAHWGQLEGGLALSIKDLDPLMHIHAAPEAERHE